MLNIERKWAMPSKNTFEIRPINEFVIKEMSDGVWIDPFANNKKLATITNDLNKEFDTDYHMDALEFLKMFDDNSIDGVLFDPPYSPRQIKECYESVGLDTQGGKLTRASFWSNMKIEIARIVKPGGKVLCFGWNSQGIGKTRGFEMQKILLVAHGGNHNDTICTVETKGTAQ
jgi:hypothetical protein